MENKKREIRTTEKGKGAKEMRKKKVHTIQSG